MLHQGRTLNAEFRSDADLTTLFSAFTQIDALESWLATEVEQTPNGLLLSMADGEQVHWHLLETQAPHFVLYRTHRGLIEIRVQRQETRQLVQVLESGFALGDEGNEAVAAAQSGWQVALGMLRFALTKSLSAPAIHVRSRRQVPAGIATIFPYFAYPQWRAEWLASPILLDQNTVSTRRDALFTWPDLRGVLAMSTERVDDHCTWVALECRAWDALRMPTSQIVEAFEESLERLHDWLQPGD